MAAFGISDGIPTLVLSSSGGKRMCSEPISTAPVRSFRSRRAPLATKGAGTRQPSVPRRIRRLDQRSARTTGCLQGVSSRAQRTGRGCPDGIVGVGSTARANGSLPALDELINFRLDNCRSLSFFVFECPLFLGAVNLAQVVYAGIFLCGRTSLHEVGNRNRGQESDDGHDDHDFNKREA
jgi:hypothetical protein